VPLPESGIIVRRGGKYQYVYKVLRTYRNEKGQPSNDRKLIGRLDAGGRLIPNDRYFDYFEEAGSKAAPVSDRIDSVKSIGAAFVVSRILQELGVDGIMKDVLGCGRAEQALTVAAYMACRGNVIEHIADWSENFTPHALLSPQKASLLFSSVSHAERMAFFKAWVALNPANSCLAYDVTSFSSYAEGMREAEWGYNRDGDRLPQINMGCYLSHGSGLPMFYVTYPGSIVDKSHLPYMMAYNDELGIRGAMFVMDRGFCSTANVQWLHSENLRYVMATDAHHKTARAAIDEARDGIISLRCRVREGIYAKSLHSRFYGVTSDMHIYHDPERAERQRADLFRSVENTEARLAQLSQITGKDAKRQARFFDIDLKKDGTFSFSRNHGRIDEAAKNFGFFCLLSNAPLDSSEILDVYRRKDIIEKGFDDLKNHIDMKRMRTHSDAAAGGKLFCAFIALIAVSHMSDRLRRINASGGHRRLSKDALLSELEKIKLVSFSDGLRIMNPLTKTQRDIFTAFGTGEADLKSYISCH
jgi:transposase